MSAQCANQYFAFARRPAGSNDKAYMGDLFTMAITKEEKQSIVDQFGSSATDTGATEVQVALLTKRIQELTEHFKEHTQDHNSRRGLLKLVGKRRRLLRYLQRNDLDAYRKLIETLKLRK
jgi:small subunit ribosomal protein S15